MWGRCFIPVSLTWGYKMFTHTGTQTCTPITKEIYIVAIHKHKTCTTHAEYTETKLMKRALKRYTVIPISRIRTLSTDTEGTYQYRTYTNTYIHHVQTCNSDAKHTETTWTHGYTYRIHKRYFTIISAHKIQTRFIHTIHLFILHTQNTAHTPKNTHTHHT